MVDGGIRRFQLPARSMRQQLSYLTISSTNRQYLIFGIFPARKKRVSLDDNEDALKEIIPVQVRMNCQKLEFHSILL